MQGVRQAAAELAKKQAKDAAAAGPGAGGGAKGALLSRTPQPSGGQGHLGNASPQRPPHLPQANDMGGGGAGGEQQRSPFGMAARQGRAGDGGGNEGGGGVARTPLFGRRSSNGGMDGAMQVRVTDSVDGPPAAFAGASPPVGRPIAVGGGGGVVGEMPGKKERIAGIGATGRGGLREGDPTNVMSSESLELDKMTNDLVKEQR